MGCRFLVHLHSGVTNLVLVSSFALQASVCNLVAIFLTGGLLDVLGIVAHPALVDYLIRSHHQDAARDVTMSASAFSLRKNTFMQNQNLYLYHIYYMYPHFVLGWM